MSIRDDMDFRFRGAGWYSGHFNEKACLDEQQRYHCEDGPAYVDGDGNKLWYIRDKLHRAGGLPAFEGKNGDLGWYEDNLPHRAGGLPAFAFTKGDREWFEHGERHRDGAPAVLRADGSSEWWVHGRQLSAPEVEDILFAQGDPATIRKRGLETKDSFNEGLQAPLKTPKPLSFTTRKP